MARPKRVKIPKEETKVEKVETQVEKVETPIVEKETETPTLEEELQLITVPQDKLPIKEEVIEVTKVVEEDLDPVRAWQKTGGGSLDMIIDGQWRKIKPNEKFYCRKSEIPKGALDVVKALESEPGKARIVTVPVVYTRKEVAEQPGFFDILDMTGKKLNEKPLSDDQSLAFIQALS